MFAAQELLIALGNKQRGSFDQRYEQMRLDYKKVGWLEEIEERKMQISRAIQYNTIYNVIHPQL